MYVILAYDVSVDRNTKILKIGRRYLTWVQNSLLEGELTPSQLKRLQYELKRAMNEEADSIQLYMLPEASLIERVSLGVIKNAPSQFV